MYTLIRCQGHPGEITMQNAKPKVQAIFWKVTSGCCWLLRRVGVSSWAPESFLFCPLSGRTDLPTKSQLKCQTHSSTPAINSFGELQQATISPHPPGLWEHRQDNMDLLCQVVTGIAGIKLVNIFIERHSTLCSHTVLP